MKSPNQNIWLAFFCALLLSGCATMEPSGYLDDYGRLRSGNNLEKVWYDPNKKMTSTSTIVLNSINTEHISNTYSVTVSDVVTWLKEGLKKYAQNENLKIVFDDNDNRGDYFLALAVTQMTPGNSVARMWAAELGAGHAKVQIEGQLSDRNGNILFSFSDLRSNSGAIGLKDLGGDVGWQLVWENIEILSRAIVLELKEHMKTN